jgi:hypothetical protein
MFTDIGTDNAVGSLLEVRVRQNALNHVGDRLTPITNVINNDPEAHGKLTKDIESGMANPMLIVTSSSH